MAAASGHDQFPFANPHDFPVFFAFSSIRLTSGRDHFVCL
jgi:hypothetical protein